MKYDDIYSVNFFEYDYQFTDNFKFYAKYPRISAIYPNHEELKDFTKNKIIPRIEDNLIKLQNSQEQIEDGGTNAHNPFTTNFFNYNFFLLSNESIMKDFFIFVNTGLKIYTKLLNLENNKLGVQCWMNVLKQLEKIDKHNHQNFMIPQLSFPLISSHYDLDVPTDFKTYTMYFNPFSKSLKNDLLLDFSNEHEVEYNENKNGKITFFPSVIEHQTTVVKTIFDRITIAMDYVQIFDDDNSRKIKNRPIVEMKI